MNIKKLIVGGVAAGALMLGAMATSAFAAQNSDLMSEQWRIYNVKPATASYWDINKVNLMGGNLQFPVQQFLSPTTGSFAVYFMNNYNNDLTGKTLSADMSWTDGTYVTRGAEDSGAYVRFWFQDVTSGPYDVNDYWWSTESCDLIGSQKSCLLNVSLDRSNWTNMAGLSANDDTTEHYYANWNGSTAKDTPYDGFTKAMKNVKQMGLSFGNAFSYASGVARVGESGNFTVSSFTVDTASALILGLSSESNSTPGLDRYLDNPGRQQAFDVGAQCGSGAGSGTFGYLGKDSNMAGGANGTQTGINNSSVCGNR